MYHRRTPAAIVLLLLLAGDARALELNRQYEEDLVRWGLAQAGLQRDPDPAGKVIERIEIVRENIIARSDPWPNFLNVFHMKTRDFVVRQEMLIRPGQVWDETLIEESARNLRKLFILAVVRTVPCRSPDPGKVVLLVVTKDLWSIRLNTNWSMVGSVVSFLDFTPTEMNFLGRNKRLSLHVGLQQLDLSSFKLRDLLELGELYVDQRLFGSRLRLVQWFDAVVAGQVPSGGRGIDGKPWVPRTSYGQLEGAYAQLRLQRPLFSLATEWAFDLWGTLNLRQSRRYVVNSSDKVPTGEQAGLSLKTVALPAADGSTAYVPRVYDTQELVASGLVTRSFGREIKHDLTWGLVAYRSRYTPPQDFPFDDVTRAAYVFQTLPRSEDAAYFQLSYSTHDTRYVKLRNVQTFALTEDFQLGHTASATTQFAANLADPAQSFIALRADAQYLWYLRDDLLLVWLTAATRWQPRLDYPGYSGPWMNRSLTVGAKNITPRLWIGRLHVQAKAQLRGNNVDHVTAYLGGDSGLRGYPANEFEGQSFLLVNAEYRTLPINFFTLHLGLILFYDGGGVFGPDPRQPGQQLPFVYHHSVGLGVRGHFPQFDKESIRVDFGVPLKDAGPVGSWISFAFQQAF